MSDLTKLQTWFQDYLLADSPEKSGGYQEVEADSLEEAIELSEDCDTELIPIDGTSTFEVDIESTEHFNVGLRNCDSTGEPLE